MILPSGKKNAFFIVVKAFTKPERGKPGGRSIADKLVGEEREIMWI